jgi:uracil-DNA glycosylase
MTACRPWLAAELRIVGPHVVVALGVTVGKAL